jgi:hypothetical protein
MFLKNIKALLAHKAGLEVNSEYLNSYSMFISQKNMGQNLNTNITNKSF